MLDSTRDAYEIEHPQMVFGDGSRTPPRQRSRIVSDSDVPEKVTRPLPWRWTVLIVTALSTLAWIVVLLAVLAVLSSV